LLPGRPYTSERAGTKEATLLLHFFTNAFIHSLQDSGASYDPFEEDEYDRGGDAHWEYDGLFTQIPFTQSPTDFEE